MTEKQRLSYSAMKQYRTCPEQYRLDRIVGLNGPPGWYNAGGTAVHKMTEIHDRMELGLLSSEDAHCADWTFKDYFYEAVEDEEKSTGYTRDTFKSAGRKTKALPNGEGENWWLLEGPSMVNRWVNWRDKLPFDIWVTPDGEAAIEIQFTMDHGDEVSTPGTIDRVFIDRESGRLITVDIKSGKPPKDNVQLGTYSTALEKRYGVDASFGGYWMARDGLLTGLHNLRPEMGARLAYDYSQTANAIRAGIFLATPSGLCKAHCDMARFCYAGGQLTDDSYLPF